MLLSLSRFAILFALPVIAACAPKAVVQAPPAVVAGYEAVNDGGFEIPAVDPKYLIEGNKRQVVAYQGTEAPGTIVVDVYSRKLYFVMEGGQAMRYGVAVGRDGTSFRGTGYVGRKREWPNWTPTPNMIRTNPEMYAAYAGGLPGGLENPLGSRALYLYRNGVDTMFRIHGTIDNSSVGRATSAGCIRMFNQDVMDLYERAGTGANVKVRTLEESIAIEGPMMDDAWGRAVPVTPDYMARKEADLIAIAEYERTQAEEAAKAAAVAAKEAAKADKKRLAQCRRQGIAAADCPSPDFA